MFVRGAVTFIGSAVGGRSFEAAGVTGAAAGVAGTTVGAVAIENIAGSVCSITSIWDGVSSRCGINRVVPVGCIVDVPVVVGKSLAGHLAGSFSCRSSNSIFATSMPRDFQT